MKSLSRCSRRCFCRRLLGGLGLLLCGGYLPAAAASPYGRPLARYRLEKLPDELQAGLNVYLVHPHRQPQVFGLSEGMRAVPGVVFTTGGYPVRAAASGIVHFIGQRSLPGAAFGGHYIRIAHDLYDGLKKPIYPRVTLYRHQAFRSTYYGLQTVDVVHWQSVRRGQIIGQARPFGATREPTVKFVLEESGNPVNPDDYGAGHGPMRYMGNQRVPEWGLEEMHRRLDRQAQVIERLNARYTDRAGNDVEPKIHGVIDTEKFSDVPVLWSTVEKLRYLQNRFRQSPQRFPGLSGADFDSLIQTFTENQPIVLTLPLTPPS